MNYYQSIFTDQVSSTCLETKCDQTELYKKILDDSELDHLIKKYRMGLRKRIFDPKTTLFAFISQVLSLDRSCQEAVLRVNKERRLSGFSLNSTNTGAYCRARNRLSEDFLNELMESTGRKIEESLLSKWLWRGRHIKVIDGSTFTVADTEENQKSYPKHKNHAFGTGFPLSRIFGVFSLFSGCVLGFNNTAFKGPQTSEHSMLRDLLHCFNPNDVVLGDAYYSAFFLIYFFQKLQVDVVFRAGCGGRGQATTQDLKTKDILSDWKKPQRPKWMDLETYKKSPASLRLRECVVAINHPGFRTKKIKIVTTFLDSKKVTAQELGWLYSQRWQVETYFRFIKNMLKLNHLRTKTPAMVRKEMRVTLLAYNFIRKLMGEAAYFKGIIPKKISFKGTLQLINLYYQTWHVKEVKNLRKIFYSIIETLSDLEVPDRPFRVEPRVRKYHPKPYLKLRKPRAIIRAEILIREYSYS